MTNRNTIYYDISDLMEYAPLNPTLSGIQRTSLITLHKLASAPLDYNLLILTHNKSSGKTYTYEPEIFRGDYNYNQTDFCEYFRLSIKHKSSERRDLNSYIYRKYGSTVRGKFHRLRLKILNKFSNGRKFNRLGINQHNYSSDGCLRAGKASTPSFKPGDVIYVTGATWGSDSHIDLLSRAHRSGVKVIQFLHDLIPLAAPEFVLDYTPEVFYIWLEKITDVADGFIANSQATRSDFLAFMQDKNKKNVPCAVVPLAHEFINSPTCGESIGAQPPFLFKKHRSALRIRASIYQETIHPFVLCVGALTARKNIVTLCRVWMDIERELGLGTPRLVYAGNNGWMNDDFQSILRATGYCNGLIGVVEEPLDHELAYLYRNCLFTVYPSFYEGWGLPIGESLWFKKPVVASKTSSMAEVGGNMVDYVDPYSPSDIKRAIMKLITDVSYRNSRIEGISKATLRSWDDVANHQLAALLQLIGSTHTPSTANTG